VDAKKKELVARLAIGGGTTNRTDSRNAYGLTISDKQLGKICPYGVYDSTHNRAGSAWGRSRQPPQCAVESIRRWWWQMGKGRIRRAHAVLITADGGGANCQARSVVEGRTPKARR